MKKLLNLTLIIMLLVSGMLIFTGCENGNSGVKANTTEISCKLGKGTITFAVPKKDDGTPKYEFTSEKPESIKYKGTMYLETDNAVLTFATSGLVYNTSKDYKEKFGEQKATFEKYIEWANNPESTINSKDMTVMEINGNKAVRRYIREGGSGNYKYYGYSYMIGVDEVYPGSYLSMCVYYKGDEELTSPKDIDSETQDIINTLKITLNN